MFDIELSNLHKTYNDGFVALKGIDLKVTRGQFIGLLGPNGAGKSTTINIINSLVQKTRGEVKIAGHDIVSSANKAKAAIGVVPQEFNFNVFETPYDILTFQAGYFGFPYKEARARAEKYLKELDLWDRRGVISRRLSGGMKRRLMIARAMVHDPQILILDEPTASVDIEIRRAMWQYLQALNQAGKTIILTTHYLEEAEALCDRIAILHHGKIIEDSPKRELIERLNTESFIFDLEKPFTPPVMPTKFNLTAIDTKSYQVDLNKNVSVNCVFDYFNQHNVTVMSLRNKANRLEELFLYLTSKDQS